MFLSLASKSDRSKICVEPAPLSDHRKSTFYRRSTASVSASEASSLERFHCDMATSGSADDDGEFMFDFPTDASSQTDSSTCSERDKATSGVTESDASSVMRDGGCCGKEVSAAGNDLKSTNSSLRFSLSATATPFLFNFDSS